MVDEIATLLETADGVLPRVECFAHVGRVFDSASTSVEVRDALVSRLLRSSDRVLVADAELEQMTGARAQ